MIRVQLIARYRALSGEKWPDSKLHQSHSGWIGLTLGVCIPGVTLLFGAVLTLIKELGSSNPHIHSTSWVISCRWGCYVCF